MQIELRPTVFDHARLDDQRHQHAEKERSSRLLARSDSSSQEGTDHLAQRSAGRPSFSHRVVLSHLNRAHAGVGGLRNRADRQGICTLLQAAGPIRGKDLGIGVELSEDFSNVELPIPRYYVETGTC